MHLLSYHPTIVIIMQKANSPILPVLQVALPRVLNSAGRIFTLAGLLKILVIAHGAVPWSGELCPWSILLSLCIWGYKPANITGAATDVDLSMAAAAVSGWEAIVTMVPFGLGRPCPMLRICMSNDCVSLVFRTNLLLHDT